MKSSVFQKIDEAINGQISAMRGQDFFHKTSELLRSFSEKEQLAINQITSLIFILSPIAIIIVSIVFRFTTASDLEKRKDVYDKIVSIKEKTSTLSSLENSLIAKEVIEDKKSLVDAIEKIIESKKMNKTNIIVDNFSIAAEGGTVKKIEASIKFKDLTAADFSNIILETQVRLKANITDIEITKNESKSLLLGSFNITLFSKQAR
ncbi:hypothetical protein [Bacteriovorax sp. Seq25_V]|uniref:hypothetical protein n=1 Tax=Bacteriovorax sp. Seq25_V TaxID=1201288 RepID=UPI00038A2B6C|nr:hypothetical protein [Bacteriovorax sp. Seq25_V]EQC46044.1 hypothetical protein M900_1665 [Bacteriovorax sp. Seq25_V]